MKPQTFASLVSAMLYEKRFDFLHLLFHKEDGGSFWLFTPTFVLSIIQLDPRTAK